MPRRKKETATLVRQDDVAPVFALDDLVEIDTPATRTNRFVVAGIRQYAGRLVQPMVDYVLEGDSGCPQVRLRLLPSENSKTHCLVLTLFDSLPYNGGLLNVVRDESATLTIHDDTGPANIAGDILWRKYDVTVSHIRSVSIRSNIGVTDAAVEYWDYSRLIEIEGTETEEFIFVEMNKADGWFEIWRGVEVAPDCITVE